MTGLGTLKEFQRLTGYLAAMTRFISKSTDKCFPFFKALKKGKDIEWNQKCEAAFQQLKNYLGRTPILSKPNTGD